MKDLDGRIALVTGAAQGIGAATARVLAEAGAKVVVSDMKDGSATAREIGGAYVEHDVTTEDSWKSAIAFAAKTFGGLDILVNNAGIFFQGSLADTSLEQFRRVMAVNVEGVFLGLKYGIPAIAQRADKWEGGGSVINLSSVAGIVGWPAGSAYSASKGAVRLMSKSAALECTAAKICVRVNSVHPGIIDTPMMQSGAETIAAAYRETIDQSRLRMAKRHPMNRLGRDTDIANAIKFLASDAAGFMTGSEVVVDGGMTAM
jgi:NAD(P)-dependent dehydrogenase (short-subunit alcohol dehydrogenase family)